MKISLALKIQIVLLLIVAVCAYPTFPEYLVQFGKHYEGQEYAFREATYNANVADFANVVNFVPGVNEFTDWTEDEKKGLSGLKEVPNADRTQSQAPVSRSLRVATSLDWRDSNIITAVKNQGGCGACWAFTSIGLVQSYLVQNNIQDINIDLSEQYSLQCTSRSRCTGGYIEYGLDQISRQIPLEADYPYIGPSLYGGRVCSASGVKTNVTRKSYYDISDSTLINLLQTTPVAVAVDSTGWGSYSSGTLTCSASGSVNHAVVAVGYTADAIIIKNSWGTTWGMNGYAYVSRSSSQNCHILNQAHVISASKWEPNHVLMMAVGLLALLAVL